jgi:hypothetical protein
MIDVNKKYKRAKMLQGFTDDYQSQLKSERNTKIVVSILIGLAIGFISFASMSATATVLTTIVGG